MWRARQAVAGLARLNTQPVLATMIIAVGVVPARRLGPRYLALDRVVARSFAEWCTVIDILLAVQLVVLVVAG